MRSRLVLVLVLVLVLGLFVRADEREERMDAGHVKVGQTYRWKLAAGNTSEWLVTAKTDDEVRYKVRATVAGKDLASAKDEEHSFALKRKAEGKEPPAGEKETLKVSGIAFPCTILETQSGGTVVKTWRSALFPETIKVQLGKDVTAELVEVVPPK